MSGRNTRTQGLTLLTDISVEDADLWQLDLDAIKPLFRSLESNLSEDERERASRYVQQKTREQFVLVRGLLREILAERINSINSGSVTASSLRFGYSQFGKPFLSEYREWQFNVAHTRNVALIAVARHRAVGVDVQWCNPEIDIEKAMTKAYSDSEKTLLQELAPQSKRAMSFQLWTLKEAYVKADGRGLSLDLKNIDVAATLAPSSFISNEENKGQQYELQPVDLTHLGLCDYKAAIAIERKERQ
jgi:4'-phosphopantetheinyl transferase